VLILKIIKKLKRRKFRAIIIFNYLLFIIRETYVFFYQLFFALLYIFLIIKSTTR